MDTLKAVARYNAQIRTKAAARYESLSSGRPLYTSLRSGRPLQKNGCEAAARYRKFAERSSAAKKILEAVARYRHDEKRSTATTLVPPSPFAPLDRPLLSLR